MLELTYSSIDKFIYQGGFHVNFATKSSHRVSVTAKQ
nr:MAG TPA: hypothetical protein [Caudoviricetes sp.]DAY22965.1 MAG TPA: hypothetical protein [Caudoviricetes sp.]